ncbi:cohesin-loading factor complex subunit SCC4 ASCRUDRAFT_117568 [Ascoidea rubescens DSM 1968]|uniref:Uncharacterized protein n=1 Tax=Ascoidea rubescens DSM 1968 TaxID=1344418 RepID=A0A1D2VB59_9ASCO|nr:hypothetical protein ASCRUDRAFT_117568 [Ascoidea rubescens DSM 1968]ODV58892.1 hypothetical protein ASCRUDRAFT_117568 [Ascoidea rubescens DSM 1968]
MENDQKEVLYDYLRPLINSYPPQVMNHILLSLSREYFDIAHNNIHHAIRDEAGLKSYFKLIYMAINCLTAILNTSKNLSPNLEASIYLKLSQIYFNETENYDIAENYVNKAITISSRVNNLNLKYISEYLASNVISINNPKVAIKYINSKMRDLKILKETQWLKVFEFYKINLLLNLDPKFGLNLLRKFNESNNEIYDKNLRQLSILFEINLNIYRGSPKMAMILMRDYFIKQLDNKNKTELELCEIPQLHSVYILNEINLALVQYQFRQGKKSIRKLSEFITDQRQNNWNNWNPDGSFKMLCQINNHHASVPFKINWLTLDELYIINKLFAGLMYLSKYFEKNKAMLYFKSALIACQKQIKKFISIGLNDEVHLQNDTKNTGGEIKQYYGDYIGDNSGDLNVFNLKLIRLNFIKFQIKFYLIYYEYMVNENLKSFDELKLKINELINELNKLTIFERNHYKNFYKKFYFILALILQNEGDLRLAKSLYLKVRELLSDNNDNNTKNDTIESYQLNFFSFVNNLGGERIEGKENHSQLYIFSTFNLILIVENNLNFLKDLSNNSIEIERLTNERNTYLQEINTYFEEENKEEIDKITNNHKIQTNEDFIKSDFLLNETKKLFNILFNDISQEDSNTILSNIIQESNYFQNISPELYSIAVLMVSEQFLDSLTKCRFLLQCIHFSTISRNKVLNYLSSLYLYHNYYKNGAVYEANLQYEKCVAIQQEITTLFGNQ